MTAQRQLFGVDYDAIWRYGAHPWVALPVLGFFSLTSGRTALVNVTDSGFSGQILIAVAMIVAWLYFVTCGAVGKWVFKTQTAGRNIFLIVLYTSTEMFRIWVMATIGVAVGLNIPAHGFPDFVAAAGSGLVFFGLAAVIVAGSYSYSDSYRALSEQSDQARSLTLNSEQILASSRARWVEFARTSVDAAIRPILAELTTAEASSSSRRELLLGAVNEVIRPLSRDIYEQPVAVTDANRIPAKMRVRLRDVMRWIPRQVTVYPVALVVILLIVTFGAVLAAQSVVFLTAMAAFLAALLLVGLAVRNVSKRLVLAQRPRLNVLIGFGFIVIAGAGFGAILQLIGIPSLNDPMLIVYFAIEGLIIGWIPPIIRAIQRARADVLVQLAESAEQLEAVNSWMQARAWLAQRDIALVLHSEVQSTIVAAGLTYQRGLDSGADIAALNQLLREALEHVVDQVFERRRFERLDEVVRKVNDLWGGLIDVHLSIDERLRSQLENNPDALQVIYELVAETANNGIKHARANRLDCVLSQLGTNQVLLRMSHPSAQPIATDPTSGLGTRLYDSLTLNWSIQHDDELTTITALISVF